ncbi:MAG: GSCFA domain-containing protein [Cyclobacteriaceae bacterium]|nr:GSCFA domain-containing protein [Cyclobacteriaceae bacterium]MDH5608448.1 GSCFA domain-containing protein [Cyclobacteriaceae bacterium]
MFTLDFNVPVSKTKISLKDPIILLGSCFSESIGRQLETHKFQTLVNPFGTIYNPASIFQMLYPELTDIEKKIIKVHGIYHYWHGHSTLSALTLDELIKNIVSKHRLLQKSLQSSNWIIVTPGTSWVYRLKTTGEVVANCHKVPPYTFTKELLDVSTIVESFARVWNIIQQKKPSIQAMFTVSPVRHIRDGLVENNRSKAILIQAVHEIVSSQPNCHYFPSYEIVNDELRDYRFFDTDLVHPNSIAIEYIWQRLKESYFDSPTQQFVDKWAKIHKAIQHKPFYPSSELHQKFLKETIAKIKGLEDQADVSRELKHLQNQLING